LIETRNCPKMHLFQPTSRPALPTRQAPARRRQSVRRPRPVGPADHAVQIPPGCRRSAEPDPTPFRKRLRSLVNRRAQDPTGRRRARRRHRRAPLRRGQFYLTTAARPGRSSRRSAPPPGRSSRPGRKQASRPASAAGRSADVPNAACLRARPSRRTLAGAIGAWVAGGSPQPWFRLPPPSWAVRAVRVPTSAAGSTIYAAISRREVPKSVTLSFANHESDRRPNWAMHAPSTQHFQKYDSELFFGPNRAKGRIRPNTICIPT